MGDIVVDCFRILDDRRQRDVPDNLRAAAVELDDHAMSDVGAVGDVQVALTGLNEISSGSSPPRGLVANDASLTDGLATLVTFTLKTSSSVMYNFPVAGSNAMPVGSVV